MNEAGDIVSINLSLEFGMDPFVFEKRAKPKSIKKEDLEIYSGEYELGAQKGIKIYAKESTLYLFVPGQPEYELISMGDHKFGVKALSGFSLEFIFEGEKLTNLKLNQPNGIFKAQKVK